jgi:hypothetical protein
MKVDSDLLVFGVVAVLLVLVGGCFFCVARDRERDVSKLRLNCLSQRNCDGEKCNNRATEENGINRGRSD